MQTYVVDTNFGQDVDKDTAKLAVKTYRTVNAKVSAAWKSIDNAAKDAIRTPGKTYKGTDKITFCFSNEAGFPALIARLPSGHCLIYPKAYLKTMYSVFHEEEMKKFYSYDEAEKYLKKKGLNVERINDDGKRMPPMTPSIGEEIQFWGKKDGRWCWESTYGGKLLENATQAVAGDIMVNGAINASNLGYEIFMLVHDQALSEMKEGQSIEQFCDALCDLPEWADGLPIEAEGGVIPYYLKD